MKILPTLAEVREIASDVNYNVLPVSCEILSDFTTPIEIIKILKNVSTHCYMLESAQANETWGRYTFLGFDPKMEITCVDGEMKIGNLKLKTEHPSDYLRQILADYKSPRFDYLPTFTGGLVGYFSYDYLGYSEPTVKCGAKDTEDFKDVDLMLFDKVIAFDHLRQKIVLIVNMLLDDVEVRYNKAVMELKRLIELLRNGEKREEPGGKLLGEVTSLFGKEQFCAMVEKAKHHIHEGNIFQIVLSNRLSAPFEGSLLNTYRVLRTINPSPYMFYFSGTDVEVAGASPETLVKLENGVLHTFPLAGTRPRGKNDEEDKALETELLADEKELAEHNMLVDLGRNDLGKISKFGTVQVEKLHSVERFSHVMHIGSTVRGEITEKHDALDAIEAVIWRGPVIAGVVTQFWSDVMWGDLDYLFVDMPPGTGDVPLTVFQSLPVDGVVIVTSPQDLVQLIVKKAYNMAKQMNIPVLGIVENYSYIKCPDCGKEIKVFGESHIDEIAKELGVPVLGKMPIDTAIAEAVEAEKFYEVTNPYLKEIDL